MKLPIVRPHFPELRGRIESFFKGSLISGQVTNGPAVQVFEEQLSEYLGAPTLAFCNGQTALLTMLLAAGVTAEDEVVLPSFTFCGTPHAVSMLGATPIFCDIDPETLTINPDSGLFRCGRGTAALIGVDVYGICCDYEAFRGCDIKCLFDSAPAFGSLPHPDATRIYSFHATKPFSTMEGGALVSNDKALLAHAKRIREFGQDEDRNCVDIGLNGKMTEICGLIGLENLRTWEERRAKRVATAAAFRKKLATVGTVKVINDPPGQEPIWTYMPVLADGNAWRDELMTVLKARGIDARRYYTACHKLTPYDTGLKLPVSEDIAARVIALPLYDEMTDEEMNYICEALA